MPLGIKDLFCTKGVHTRPGSHILDGFGRANESTGTQNSLGRRAVMLGKLTWDEFRHGSSKSPAFLLRPGHPIRGGGGAAMTISSRAARPAARPPRWPRISAPAHCNRTGGSIRQPAFTGTVGIKPTYGRCSRWASCLRLLARPGRPVARNVRDAAICCKSMASVDRRTRPRTTSRCRTTRRRSARACAE